MGRLDARAARIVALIACAIVVLIQRPAGGAGTLSLLFSPSNTLGAPARIATDAQGFIYVAGRVSGGPGAAAYVTRLTPSRSVVYTRVFQVSRFGGEFNDCALDIAAIAADPSGAAYITGCTTAIDLPLVRPFRSTPTSSRGSAFLAKLDAAGNIVYSTYFGAGGGITDSGTGIAADGQGNAYVTGFGSGPNLPLVNPAATRGSGWVAKFNPAGSALLYSTYVGGTPRAIAIDRAGAAYVAGSGTLGAAGVRAIQPCHDQFRGGDATVIKLSPSGSSFEYATCLGGLDDDAATGIAVDASGAAYVVGSTQSLDFPTLHALDVPFRTSPLWKTSDAGLTWTNLPLDAFSVNALEPSKTTRGGLYAATLFGAFKDHDGGSAWENLGLPLRLGQFEPSVLHIAVDPRAPSTLYAATSDGLVKSTDGGGHWNTIGTTLPSGGAFLRGIAVSPTDSRIVYAASQRGFFRSLNGGVTWTASNAGLGTDPFVSALAVDPANGTLYADVSVSAPVGGTDRVFVSTNAGVTWTATPLSIAQRSVTALTVVRERRLLASPGPRWREKDIATGASSVVYLAARQVFSEGPFGVLFSSGDGGRTWQSIGNGLPPAGADALAASPANPAIVYAGSRGVLFVSGDGGATFEPVPGMPTFGSIASIAVDPRDAATVYVATSPRFDAFIAKIRPGGGALDYATYFGGAADDRASGVVVDDLGRAIVVGTTESADLPAVAAVQERRAGTDGFVAVVDGGGSVLLFSTWVGGNGTDSVVSAAPTGGRLLISGSSSDLATMFPDGGAAGSGAFVGLLDLSFGASFRRAGTSAPLLPAEHPR